MSNTRCRGGEAPTLTWLCNASTATATATAAVEEELGDRHVKQSGVMIVAMAESSIVVIVAVFSP